MQKLPKTYFSYFPTFFMFDTYSNGHSSIFDIFDTSPNGHISHVCQKKLLRWKYHCLEKIYNIYVWKPERITWQENNEENKKKEYQGQAVLLQKWK